MAMYGHYIGLNLGGIRIAICKGNTTLEKKSGKAHTPPGVSHSNLI